MIGIVKKEGSSSGDFSGLDLSKLQFPSDSVTIRQLRIAHADLFDRGFGRDQSTQPQFFFKADEPGHAEDTIGEMLQCERLIAVNAYAEAIGVAAPEVFVSFDELKRQLAELYLLYGLAQGPHHASELIRDIEHQGTELGNSRHP